MHDAAFRSCLMRHQLHAQHFAGEFARLFHRLGDFYAAALAASAGMDLRLDYYSRRARTQNFFCGCLSLFASGGHHTPRHGDAVLLQDCFSLILVNVHSDFKTRADSNKLEETRLRIEEQSSKTFDSLKHDSIRRKRNSAKASRAGFALWYLQGDRFLW